MSSPVNGGFACFNCGLLLAPDTARCPRCGAPQPGRANGCPGAGHPSHVPPAEPLHPAVTAIITFFFGLFGLIPCLISTSRAKRLSLPTRPHWLAFWIPELVRVSIYVIVAIGMIAGVSILAGLAPRSPGGSGGVAPSSSYSYSTTAPSATSSSALGWPAGAVECSSSVAAGNDRTSCEFALNVADAWQRSDRASTQTVEAYSPVTNEKYTMGCATVAGYTTCSGGNGAVVYIRS